MISLKTKDPSCSQSTSRLDLTIRPRKHINQKHDPQIQCVAGQQGHTICDLRFPTKKDMEFHVLGKHKDFANDPSNGITGCRKACPVCEKIVRSDQHKRHVDEQHYGKRRDRRPKS